MRPRAEGPEQSMRTRSGSVLARAVLPSPFFLLSFLLIPLSSSPCLCSSAPARSRGQDEL